MSSRDSDSTNDSYFSMESQSHSDEEETDIPAENSKPHIHKGRDLLGDIGTDYMSPAGRLALCSPKPGTSIAQSLISKATADTKQKLNKTPSPKDQSSEDDTGNSEDDNENTEDSEDGDDNQDTDAGTKSEDVSSDAELSKNSNRKNSSKSKFDFIHRVGGKEYLLFTIYGDVDEIFRPFKRSKLKELAIPCRPLLDAYVRSNPKSKGMEQQEFFSIGFRKWRTVSNTKVNSEMSRVGRNLKGRKVSKVNAIIVTGNLNKIYFKVGKDRIVTAADYLKGTPDQDHKKIKSPKKDNGPRKIKASKPKKPRKPSAPTEEPPKPILTEEPTTFAEELPKSTPEIIEQLASTEKPTTISEELPQPTSTKISFSKTQELPSREELSKMILSQQEEISILKQLLESQKKMLKKQKTELKIKDEALKSKDEALKSKDEALKSKDEALKSREEALKARDEMVKEALKARDEMTKEALKAKDDTIKILIDTLSKRTAD